MADESSTKEELEQPFILRLPPEDAKKVKKMLRKKPKKLKKSLKIDLDPETREAEVTIRKKVIQMKLVDLPTISESLKTYNKYLFFKTGDICQMLVPDTKNPEDNNHLDTKSNNEYMWKHGITPPLKNVKNRFRRVIRKKQTMDAEEIEKELRWLFQSDNDAVAVRWELVDDPNLTYKEKNTDDSLFTEKDIFGDILSSTSESTEEEVQEE